METFIVLAVIAVVVWLLVRFMRGSSAARPGPIQDEVSAYAAENPDNVFHSKIAGVSHGNRQRLLAECHVGERLRLVAEPDNPVDPNAIKVCRKNGAHLGYLTAHLAERMTQGQERLSDFVVEISELTGGTRGKPTRGANLKFVRYNVHRVTIEV
jgi:hypothetical protein